MARTNWGEELSRFANEWRQTGIKPKEWSDREGHSWGTAKNHITIKAAKALLSGSGGKIANSEKKSRKKDPQKSRICSQEKSKKVRDVTIPGHPKTVLKIPASACCLVMLISLLTPMNSAFLTSRLSLRCLLLKGKSRQRHTDWLGMKGKETLHG